MRPNGLTACPGPDLAGWVGLVRGRWTWIGGDEEEAGGSNVRSQVLRNFVLQGRRQVVVEQAVEDWRQVAADHLVIADVDPLKDGLVEITPAVVVADQVVVVSAEQQFAAALECRVDLLDGQLRLAESAFQTGAAGRDPGLFLTQVVDIDGVGVVGLQQLVGFGFQLSKPTHGRPPILVAGWQHDVQVVADDLPDVGHGFVTQPDAGPVILDQLLNDVLLGGDEAAAVLLGLTPEAVEV